MDKRRVKQSVILAAAVIVIIILVLIIGKIIQKYTPTKEEMDLYEYFGVKEQSSAAIVLNHEIIPQQAVIKDGMLYVDYDTLREVFTSRFYWDTNENLLLYTTPSDVISAAASGKEYYITKEKKSEKYTIVFADGERNGRSHRAENFGSGQGRTWSVPCSALRKARRRTQNNGRTAGRVSALRASWIFR